MVASWACAEAVVLSWAGGGEKWSAGPQEGQSSRSRNSCMWTWESDGIRMSQATEPGPLESGRLGCQ